MAKTQILKTLDFCAIDTETTGFSPKTAEIIEIAIIRFRDGKAVYQLHTLLRPDNLPIPSEITKLTGIRTEDVLKKPKLPKITNTINKFLQDDIIVGQNPTFDVRFLEANNIGPIHTPIIDTARIARRVYPELSNYKLGTIINRCEQDGMVVRQGNAHRADWDAIMTGECYVFMLPKLKIQK